MKTKKRNKFNVISNTMYMVNERDILKGSVATYNCFDKFWTLLICKECFSLERISEQ